MGTDLLSKPQLKELVRRVIVAQGNAFIKELLRSTGARVGASKEDFANNLDAAIDADELTQEKLEAWLAEVEGWGDQHLYLIAPPEVDPSNYAAAIDLVDIEEALGQREHAGQLLDRSESLIRSFPRMGPWGFGIADAQILALRGEDDKALAALHAAMKAGWRGPAWRYYRDFDSNLASIRNEPEFKEVFADIERDMAQQRARLAARPKDAQLELTQVAR